VNAPLVLAPASSSTSGSYTFSNASATASHPLVIGGTVTGGTTTQGIALNLQGANTGSNAINGSISDGGATAGVSLTKDANGSWILSGSNSYIGGTTLATGNGGTLKLSGSGTLGSTNGSLTVNGGTLDLNGTSQGVGNLTGTGGTILNNSTGTNVTLTIGNNNGTGGNYQGVIANNTAGTGTVALTKNGTGTITLSGTNTYTGATSINAGKLIVNGSTAAGSAVTATTGGTLGGSGTVNGTVNVTGTGRISPGTSPGTLNTGATTYDASGVYTWEINNATGTKGVDPGWDWQNITGALTISATSGNQFTIDINGLTAGNSLGAVPNFNKYSNYSWIIATASGGIVNFSADKFAVSPINFASNNSISGTAANGVFSISVSGNDLVLNYTGAVDVTNFYSKATGDLDVLSTWGTNVDGTGTAPVNFTTAGQQFNIRNRTTATIGANWTVSGTGSKVILGNLAVAGVTFTVPSSFSFTGLIDLNNASSGSNTLVLQNTTIPTLGSMGTSSTVDYDSSSGQTISAANYGNLQSSSTGARTLASTGTIGVATSFIPGSNTYTITGSTIDFNGAGQTVIPAFNYHNLTSSNSGGRTLVNGSGTIGVASVFTPGTNVYTPSTSTFEYNGTSAQTMPSTRGFVYYNLSINNAAGVTAPNTGQTVVVNNTLFLKNGALAPATTASLHLANNATIDRSSGSISAAPTFDGNVNVSYTGATAVTTGAEIPTSSSVLTDLTINKSGGVTLGTDVQANGTLTLTSGIVTTGTNMLILGTSATSTGASNASFVNGFLRKLSLAASFKFDVGSVHYTPVTVQPTLGLGNVTLKAFHGFYSRIGSTSTALQHYWNLTSLGINSANLTFQYPITDVNGNDAIYEGYYFDGSTVVASPSVRGSVDVNNNTQTPVGGSVLLNGDWTFAQPGQATAVSLTDFKAVSYADGVELNWESGFEVNNLGYQLYREDNGQRTRVTPSVVAGSALTVGPGKRFSAGYSYTWFDPQGTSSSGYSLEAIDLDGSSEWAGPIYPMAGRNGGQTRKAPRHERAMLLNEINGDGQAQSAVSSWPCMECDATSLAEAGPFDARLFEKAERGGIDSKRRQAGVPGAAAAQGWRVAGYESGVEPPHSTEASLAVQQAIAGGRAVKLQVRKSGWYRVTQAELVAAGFDPSADARTLQLYVDGEEVPISLSSEGARLGNRDTLEFYGVGLDTPTTDTRVYWLVSGNTTGKRMIARRGKLKPGSANTEIASGSFDMTVERRERLVYFSGLLNGDTENIFGASVRSDAVTQSLQLKEVALESVTPGQVEVALQGLTTGTHTVQLQVNGTNVGTMTFAGTEHKVAKFTVSAGLLHEGNNVVSLASQNGQSDVSLIDWVRLTYARKYKAENNTLRFSALGGQTVKLEGFSSPNVRVVDVTDANSPVQLSAYAESKAGGYEASVQATGTGLRELLAFTEEVVSHPVSITANQPTSWRAGTNGADMLIITHRDFRQAIEPLASLRRNQGLMVAVVDVEDIYDEFSYGAHTPAAIKSFLATAAADWSRKPGYLLLVGDSSWDPRNYLERGENDFVPTKLIDTQGMETGSDDWLADFNDVGTTQMSIGRLPARTVTEVNLMVGKIMAYEQEREMNAPLRGAVMVADRSFETQSSQTRALLPGNMTVQTINRAEVGNDELMRGQIVDALNQGPMLVNYYGHGSVRVWTGAGLLSNDLAGALTNGNRLSVYVMMTCLNGYANDANIDSLGEAALKAPHGGAVAVWASSGFTIPQPQFEMNTEFYRLLFSGQPMRLGDAARNAKAATSDLDVRRTWILLGDPAMRVR
jgi:autotransporter-associated beta strand protein